MGTVHLGTVRELRTAKGWSQEELATRAKIRRATLSDLEAGKTKGIDFETLARIAEALGVNAGALIVHDAAKRAR